MSAVVWIARYLAHSGRRADAIIHATLARPAAVRELDVLDGVDALGQLACRDVDWLTAYEIARALGRRRRFDLLRPLLERHPTPAIGGALAGLWRAPAEREDVLFVRDCLLPVAPTLHARGEIARMLDLLGDTHLARAIRAEVGDRARGSDDDAVAQHVAYLRIDRSLPWNPEGVIAIATEYADTRWDDLRWQHAIEYAVEAADTRRLLEVLYEVRTREAGHLRDVLRIVDDVLPRAQLDDELAATLADDARLVRAQEIIGTLAESGRVDRARRLYDAIGIAEGAARLAPYDPSVLDVALTAPGPAHELAAFVRADRRTAAAASR